MLAWEGKKEILLYWKSSVCFLPAQHLILSTLWVSVEEARLDYHSFADSGSHFISQAFGQRQQVHPHKLIEGSSPTASWAER